MTVNSRILILSVLAALSCSTPANAQAPPPATTTPAADVLNFGRPQIAIVNGYPELHVEGEPFFVHAADFPYYGVPRDLWPAVLARYAELGINTISLRVPWSWHQLSESEFDFDGHTHPRRDLRGLLRLVRERKFKLIVHAGLSNAPDLHAGGFPEWFPARPEIEVALLNRMLGILPPDFSESPPVVIAATRWLTAFARELATYEAGAATSTVEPARDDSKNAPNFLLFVIFDPPEQLTSPREISAPLFEKLREAMVAGGLETNFMVATPNLDHGQLQENFSSGIGLAGMWPQVTNAVHDLSAQPRPPKSELSSLDLETLSWLTQNLRTQPTVPAILSSFVAGKQYAQSDTAPSHARGDLLLASRAFIAQGTAGIGYTNFESALSPHGYESPNQQATETAAIDVAGNSLPPAEVIRRNGQLIRRSGAFLASAHRRTLLGIVDWRSALPPERSADAAQFSATARRIERVAELADVPTDIVDPERQPLLFLLHDTALLLQVPSQLQGRSLLSPNAEQALLEFIRRGGILICTPQLPSNSAIAEAFQSADPAPGETRDAPIAVRTVGSGHVVAWSDDFVSWVRLDESPAETRAQPEARGAIDRLRGLLAAQHAHPPVLQSALPADSLTISELLPNVIASSFGNAVASCHAGHRCAEGLLSVTNSADAVATDTLRILAPTANHRIAAKDDYVRLPVEIPARESLMLPLDTSLCIDPKSGDDCADRVVAAGAELHAIAREGKTLQLTFYAPANATVLLHLEKPPRHVDLIERSIDGQYDVVSQIFTMQIPRGPAPNYERVEKIQMPYTPHVLELPKPESNKRHEFSAVILNDIRIPAPSGNWLPGNPALIVLDPAREGHILVNVKNPRDSWFSVKAEISGAATGSKSIRVENQANNIESVPLSAGDSSAPDEDGLLKGMLRLSTSDQSVEFPLRFLVTAPDKSSRYRFDFQRDASVDLVIENSELRVVINPAAGGRIDSLTRKNPSASVTSRSGALRDYLRLEDQPAPVPITLNTTFDARWTGDPSAPGVSLSAQLPEASPLKGILTKTIRVTDERRIEAIYRLTPSGAPVANDPHLITTFSFPAIAAAEQGTQFCWKTSEVTGLSLPAASAKPLEKAAPAHCESFAPNSPPLRIPENILSLEIRNQGQPALTIDWPRGSASIEQHGTWCEFRLEFVPVSGPQSNSEVSATVSYTLGPGSI